MSNLIILLILFFEASVIFPSYLAAELNYAKPLLERNKIVNKGIWIKNNNREIDITNTGNFIFSRNSLESDNEYQNNFDAFRNSFMQEEPIVSKYVERTKRSSDDEKERISKDSLKACNGDQSCTMKKLDGNIPFFVKSKIISKLRPASVLNDYPYEVAILLSNFNHENNHIRTAKDSGYLYKTVIPLIEGKEDIVYTSDNAEAKADNMIKYNYSDNNITPKKRMKSDYESQIVKKIEFTEEFDKIDDNSSTNKVDRNVFDKEERIWYQNAPNLVTNIKNESRINKPINERGLIRVLSMLTRTFKKIMKHHNDIKNIHTKLHSLNDDVTKNIADMTRKFQDIEEKYAHIVDVSHKIKEFEVKMNAKEEYFKAKDRDMSDNLLEFENQQKKFLAQQRQFYNIQKLMLAQNEKVNMKQNLIAKTQSEISYRQNNFARILKKTRLYINNKHSTQNNPSTLPPQPTAIKQITKISSTSTQSPYTTESVKINLFSIPALNKLVNQDSLILKEKDKKPVDDLIYKYYFNNTFIDTLMKSNVLTSFVNTPHNTNIIKNIKNKRDEDVIETTILLPVKNFSVESKVRAKRWVHRTQSKSKWKRKSRGKTNVEMVEINDEKPFKKRNMDEVIPKIDDTLLRAVKNKSNPFTVMARNFCNEIGQNMNSLILSWCVEKVLRRLQHTGLNMHVTSDIKSDNKPLTTKLTPITTNSKHIDVQNNLQAASSLGLSPTSSPMSQTTTTRNDERASTLFFPDNDELESNLKQFDLKPDTEGNVYYDGSIHTSDIVLENGGFSDVMQDLGSNSRIEMDPLILNMRHLRRDPMRRLAELKRIAHAHG